jgi:hypothetical protein
MNQTANRDLSLDIHDHQQGEYVDAMIEYLYNQNNLSTSSITASIEPLYGSNQE